MEKLQQLLELDELIAEEKTKLKRLKETVVDVLEARREKLADELFDEMPVTTLEIDNVLWKKDKGRESVEAIKGATIPERFRTALDKRLVLKVYKASPEEVAAFATVTRGKGKLTYKRLT